MRPGEVHVWRIPAGDEAAGRAAFADELVDFARAASHAWLFAGGQFYLPCSPSEFRAALAEDLV